MKINEGMYFEIGTKCFKSSPLPRTRNFKLEVRGAKEEYHKAQLHQGLEQISPSHSTSFIAPAETILRAARLICKHNVPSRK